jgi:beta-glucosidase
MKNQLLRSLFLLFALVFAPICLQIAAQAPAPDSSAIEAQAHALLSKLTLEQKIELLGGIDGMYTRPMPAIDLPRFKMSDASVGVRTWGPTTASSGKASAATPAPAASTSCSVPASTSPARRLTAATSSTCLRIRT